MILIQSLLLLLRSVCNFCLWGLLSFFEACLAFVGLAQLLWGLLRFCGACSGFVMCIDEKNENFASDFPVFLLHSISCLNTMTSFCLSKVPYIVAFDCSSFVTHKKTYGKQYVRFSFAVECILHMAEFLWSPTGLTSLSQNS